MDRSAVDDWELDNGNGYRSVGVGGAIIGDGFHLLIVDDPHKSRDEVESEVTRENVKEWFTQDLYSRQEPGAAIIVIMSRWHEDDLVGYLLSEYPDEWTVIDLPALAEDNDPLGRAPGDALCPDRYDVAALMDRRKVHGEYHFLSQYQQRPTAKEGSFFRIDRLQFCDTPPAHMRLVRAWDMAATEGEGNFTAGVLMGEYDGFYYVVDVERGQWETNKRDRIIRTTAQLDGFTVKVHGPQDPGSAGKDAMIAFRKNLAGFGTAFTRPSVKKELRADPFSSQVNGGNVFIVRGAWNKAFIEELRQFPLGKNDDQVDAVSDAFNYLSRYGEAIAVSPVSERAPEIQVPGNQYADYSSVRVSDDGGLLVPSMVAKPRDPFGLIDPIGYLRGILAGQLGHG